MHQMQKRELHGKRGENIILPMHSYLEQTYDNLGDLLKALKTLNFLEPMTIQRL